MLRWIAALIAVSGLAMTALLVAPSPATSAEAPVQKKPRFVLNLTSGSADVHRSTMALSLAKHAIDDGREVVIFLNVRGAELARKEGPKSSFGDNPPPNKMLADLITSGAQVHVCPMCLEGLSMKKDDLISGCTITDRQKLFSKLTEDATVFSY